MKIISVFLLAFLLINCVGADAINVDKVKFKEYIEHQLPGISTRNQYEQIIRLRNFAYHRIKVGKNGEFNNDFERLKAIFDGKVPLLCGGISLSYQALLEAFDIKAKSVQLLTQAYVDGKNVFATHVVNEVFSNNTWMIEDATFNIEFNYEGNRLNLSQLKDVYSTGLTPTIDNNGFEMLPGRTLEAYKFDYSLYLYVMYDIQYKIWN